MTWHHAEPLVLDFFAGSGTTGHAVINLNREDGGRRKFILIEMADYFDTVLLPRLKKVTFSPEWKDGKPKRSAAAEEAARGPRILKVIRLESYEDALNNITLDDAAGQPAMQFDDYLLQYMLRWEARQSETLLNVEKLSRPFDYTLRIHTEGWTQTDYERDKQFVAEHKLTEGADEVFVNGDSLIPNAQALEPLFKARMFAPVEA